MLVELSEYLGMSIFSTLMNVNLTCIILAIISICTVGKLVRRDDDSLLIYISIYTIVIIMGVLILMTIGMNLDIINYIWNE